MSWLPLKTPVTAISDYFLFQSASCLMPRGHLADSQRRDHLVTSCPQVVTQGSPIIHRFLRQFPQSKPSFQVIARCSRDPVRHRLKNSTGPRDNGGSLKEERFLARISDPRGRSSRFQYSTTLLGVLGVTFLLALLLNRPVSADAAFLFRLLILVVLPLAVIAHIRRFHDLGRSGWGVLLFLIPFLNLVWFIHLLTTPSVATPEPAIA